MSSSLSQMFCFGIKSNRSISKLIPRSIHFQCKLNIHNNKDSFRQLIRPLSCTQIHKDFFRQLLPSKDYNILNSYKTQISEKLHHILNVDKNLLYSALQKPNKLNDGDLILPLPKIGLNIKDFPDLQQNIASILHEHDLFDKVVFKGSFIQFFINTDILMNKTVPEILTSGSQYGKVKCLPSKRILVEFSSPNIAKPFHAGHLRSTIIGEFISNLFENFGWNVVRMNYLGDWGKQFGILAVGYEKFGNPLKLKEDPIAHLFEVYVETNKLIETEKEKNETNESSISKKAQSFFKRMEDGDPSALSLWNQFRNLSIKKYTQTYSKLGISFDVYSGESQIKKQSIINILKKLKDMKLTKENDGATEMDLRPFNKNLGKIIISKSDNTSLYVTRDICACIDRYNQYKFDKMIYVIASQQDLYMKQLFEIMRQLKTPWADKLEHINFGMVKGMSTRKGNVVFLDTIIDEVTKQMVNVMNSKKQLQVEESKILDVAEKLGLSAILIQDMKSKRINNYAFDWNRMLSFEGNTGPYLQYTHVRLCAIESKVEGVVTIEDCKTANLSILNDKPEAINLVRLLSQYHYVLDKTLESLEPSTLVTYLFTISHQISTCYNSLWVLGQPREIATAHLALYLASKQVLANGLRILGIEPIKRM